MLDVIIDTLIDTFKLLPFLFLTYLIMEYIEHKTSSKTKEAIKKSGKFGPLLGGLVGIFPQCGFSVSATNLYAGRVITLGTLMAVYLSTSDEMLPILISEAAPISLILKILGIKLVIGIVVGFIIDMLHQFSKKRNFFKNQPSESSIEKLCEHDHCHCEEGIFKSAIRHTISITLFIAIITFLINTVIFFIGEDNLSNLLGNTSFLAPILASLIGLIPNCAGSVILTKLFLSNVISASAMIGGLLVSSGVGLIVLFKINRPLKDSFKIVTLLYIISVICAIGLQYIGLSL